MDTINNILSCIKNILAGWWNKIDNVVDQIFPDPDRKKGFYIIIAGLELFLLYLIAIFDFGIWIGDCTPFGIFIGYLKYDRRFPFLPFLLLSGGLLAAMYLYLRHLLTQTEDRGFTVSESNVYGKANVLSREEIEKVAIIAPKQEALNTIYGQLDKTENNLITMRPGALPNNNIICFGSPGSGKTFSFVIPFILQAIRRGESVICTDTKGDLWASTVEVARRYGYTVRRLDLRHPEYSDGWNVLAELRCDDVRAQVACELIMLNTGNESDSFIAAEGALLKALLLYTERNNAIPVHQKTIYNALLLLENSLDNLDKIFTDCKYDDLMKVAYDAYIPFKNGSPNLRNNVINGLMSRLSILTSPPVKRLTSTTDIDLTLPAYKPCLYYCNLSDQHEAMRFLSSLYFSYQITDLVEYADAQPARRCPVRVNLVAEELLNLGRLPNLGKALNSCRSRNIDIALCVQDYAQLLDRYENLTDSIMSACATHLCYGFNNRPTAEYYEWRSGEATVKVKTEQHQIIENPVLKGFNYSTGDGRRYVYTSNDLMTMPARHVFIAWQRADCIIVPTFGMNRHIEYIEGRMKEISTETSVPLSNVQARAFLRAKEEQRVIDYENWLRNGGNPWTSYTTPAPQFEGPSSGTTPPEIIPYPELEKMALAFAEQAEPKCEDKRNFKKDKQPEAQPVATNMQGSETLLSLDNLLWEDTTAYNDHGDCDIVAHETSGSDSCDITAQESYDDDTYETNAPEDPIYDYYDQEEDNGCEAPCLSAQENNDSDRRNPSVKPDTPLKTVCEPSCGRNNNEPENALVTAAEILNSQAMFFRESVSSNNQQDSSKAHHNEGTITEPADPPTRSEILSENISSSKPTHPKLSQPVTAYREDFGAPGCSVPSYNPEDYDVPMEFETNPKSKPSSVKSTFKRTKTVKRTVQINE